MSVLLPLLSLSWDTVNVIFQSKVYSGSHDLMQKPMSFNDVTIVSVKGNDYRINFWYMGKDEAIDLLKTCWFDWKKQDLIIVKI